MMTASLAELPRRSINPLARSRRDRAAPAMASGAREPPRAIPISLASQRERGPARIQSALSFGGCTPTTIPKPAEEHGHHRQWPVEPTHAPRAHRGPRAAPRVEAPSAVEITYDT